MTEKIGIFSNGGRAYFFIINELMNLGIPFKESEKLEKLDDVNVILATKKIPDDMLKLFSNVKIFYLSENIMLEDAQIIISEAIYYSKRKNPPKNIIFGIDPGNKKFGFVCLLDDVIIKRDIYRRSISITREIKKLVEKIHFKDKIYIFLGGGTGFHDFSTLQTLENRTMKHKVIFKIIEEDNSSKYGNDAMAAYFIALKGISKYIF